jgi:hypothetical protein
MSQTATLSDFTRTPFDGEGLYCALGSAPKTLAVVSSSVWEIALTGMMLVLAPVVLVALAGAFVFACLRIHASELGVENEVVCNPPPIAAAREPSHFSPRGRMLECSISDHLWN